MLRRTKNYLRRRVWRRGGESDGELYEPTRREPVLARLPIELIQEILSNISEPQTLKSAILSCRLVHSAFTNYDREIRARVILNHVGIDLLPEAVAALQSYALKGRCRKPEFAQKTLGRVSEENIKRFAGEYLDQRRLPSVAWAADRGLALLRLHRCARDIAMVYARHIVSLDPRPATGGRAFTDPTPQEIDRIVRTLYRFEIYCNLFADIAACVGMWNWTPDHVHILFLSWQRDWFFSKFSPWENEQLGCIHDFLVRVIHPAFTPVATNVRTMLYPHNTTAMWPPSPYVQFILSRGLRALHRILRTDTCSERYSLLSYERGNMLPSTTRFLSAGLPNAGITFHPAINHGSDLADLNQPPSTLPFFDDPDPGPSTAWRWAHRVDTVYRPDRTDLRAWGYVFWDQARLDAMQIFDAPWSHSRTRVVGREKRYVAVLPCHERKRHVCWSARLERENKIGSTRACETDMNSQAWVALTRTTRPRWVFGHGGAAP